MPCSSQARAIATQSSQRTSSCPSIIRHTRMVPDATPWWRDATVYQVYPRSFQDSDGDGVGDLEGIRRRLPYLAWLDVEAVWLSPIYPSPMADFGYDISDHCDVDPLFGTLADFDRLAAEAHSLGLKLLLDYVPNHTSDRHPWFEDARAGGTHRDWYLWRGRPPPPPPHTPPVGLGRAAPAGGGS